tara:strand:- start:186 stop:389 length:204 start_codon:yes stop_codon:yes gene_type:complete
MSNNRAAEFFEIQNDISEKPAGQYQGFRNYLIAFADLTSVFSRGCAFVLNPLIHEKKLLITQVANLT